MASWRPLVTIAGQLQEIPATDSLVVPALTVQNGSAALPSICATSDTNTGIYFPAADNIALTTAGAVRLRVDSLGQVGIGVTPADGLQMYVNREITTTTRTDYCGLIQARCSHPSGAFSQYGNYGMLYTIPGFGGTGAMIATAGSVVHMSAATLVQARGLQGYLGVVGPGTMDVGFGVMAGNCNATFGGVINTYASHMATELTGATANIGYYSTVSAAPAGGIASATISSISGSTTTATVNTAAAHGYSTGQLVTVVATANATALTNGCSCTILTAGTTNFVAIGAANNNVGTVFTATGAGTGSGTVRLNASGSGKYITVTSATAFTITTESFTYAAVTCLTGTVTVATKWTEYHGGTAPSYHAGKMSIGRAEVFGNTHVLIDRLGTGTIPSLTAGTVLTLVGASATTSPAYLQLISGNAADCGIFFGDTDLATRGSIYYDHPSETMTYTTYDSHLFQGEVKLYNAIRTRIGTATVAGGDTSAYLNQDDVAILVGSGAPSASAANGSMYLRTDGAANSRLYMRGGGAWNAVTSA